MYKRIILVSTGLLLMVATTASYARSNMQPQFHKSTGGSSTSNGTLYSMTEVVKNIPINGYSSPTIGSAFETYRYFSKREWSETISTNDKVYVTFRGYFKSGILNFGFIKNKLDRQGVEVKFVVFPSGAYELALVSKLVVATDGMVRVVPVVNSKEVFESILRNKELDFYSIK